MRTIPLAIAAFLFILPVRCEIVLTCPSNATELRLQITDMFNHAYTAYETHAFPADELNPLSCTPSQSFGGLSVSLIDTLDSFIVFRQWKRFAEAVRYLTDHQSFAIDETVSVFETTIRVLGGLLSAHGFLVDPHPDVAFDPHVWCPWYNDSLLYLAKDLADRLMPAFDTPTKIPYGSINLVRGVASSESRVASTAGAGSLILEFGTLTRYLKDPKYYNAAFDAMNALYSRASKAGLVGNHINIITGSWVATEAGVGGLVDSFYEYMLKGYILFGDKRLLRMFETSYEAVRTYIHKRPWYLDADMWTGYTSSFSHSSLAAFWPGLQVLFGDIDDAIETTRAHYAVWRKYGCLPEGYQVVQQQPMEGRINYPLRPELVESVFYLHWATNDSSWVSVAASMMKSIEQDMRVDCGYAAVKNVVTMELEDLMPSFVMSETFKYMYLVFVSVDENGKRHWARSGEYVFTTEAHPLRVVEGKLKEILGPNFDEDEKVEESTSEVYTTRPTMSRRHKCKRRISLESDLPCGYSMPGTDFPKLEAATVLDPTSSRGITPSIVNTVTLEIHERTRDDGNGGGVSVGDVIFGEGWACRIVGIEGQVVSFERLGDMEAQLELQKRELETRLNELKVTIEKVSSGCKRGSAVDLFRNAATCQWAWDKPQSSLQWR